MSNVLWCGGRHTLHGLEPSLKTLKEHNITSTHYVIENNLSETISQISLALDTKENVNVLVVGAFFWDFVEQAANEGIMRTLPNVEIAQLVNEIVLTTQRWKTKLPHLRVIWMLPPKFDFFLFNSNIALVTKDPLSKREEAECINSSRVFNDYINMLFTLIKEKKTDVEVFSLQSALDTIKQESEALRDIRICGSNGLLENVFHEACQKKLLNVLFKSECDDSNSSSYYKSSFSQDSNCNEFSKSACSGQLDQDILIVDLESDDDCLSNNDGSTLDLVPNRNKIIINCKKTAKEKESSQDNRLSTDINGDDNVGDLLLLKENESKSNSVDKTSCHSKLQHRTSCHSSVCHTELLSQSTSDQSVSKQDNPGRFDREDNDLHDNIHRKLFEVGEDASYMTERTTKDGEEETDTVLKSDSFNSEHKTMCATDDDTLEVGDEMITEVGKITISQFESMSDEDVFKSSQLFRVTAVQLLSKDSNLPPGEDEEVGESMSNDNQQMFANENCNSTSKSSEDLKNCANLNSHDRNRGVEDSTIVKNETKMSEKEILEDDDKINDESDIEMSNDDEIISPTCGEQSPVGAAETMCVETKNFDTMDDSSTVCPIDATENLILISQKAVGKSMNSTDVDLTVDSPINCDTPQVDRVSQPDFKKSLQAECTKVSQVQCKEVSLANCKRVLPADCEEVLKADCEEVLQATREEVSQATREEVSQATREEVSQATREEVSQATREEVSQAIREEVSQATCEKVSQATCEKVSQATCEEVSQATCEEVSQATREEVSQATREEGSQATREEGSQATREECRQLVRNFRREPVRKFCREPVRKFHRQPVRKFRRQPVRKFRRQPVRKFRRQPVRKFRQQPVRKFRKQPVRKFRRQPVRKFCRQPVRKFRRQPVRKFRRQPVRKFRRQPVRKFRRQPVRKFRRQPVRKFRRQPVRKFRRQPVRKFRRQPVRKFRRQPVRKFRRQPVRKFRRQPVRKFRRQPVRKFCRQPVRKFCRQPARKFRRQPARKFCRQPARKFCRQPARKFRRHPVRKFRR